MPRDDERRWAVLTAQHAGRERAEPSSVPVQIYDLDGALLTEGRIPTTRDAADVSADADSSGAVVEGRDQPGPEPTTVPTLGRLFVAAQESASGAAPRDPAQPPDEHEDVPRGSALSTLDAVTLFGAAAREQVVDRR